MIFCTSRTVLLLLDLFSVGVAAVLEINTDFEHTKVARLVGQWLMLDGKLEADGAVTCVVSTDCVFRGTFRFLIQLRNSGYRC